jgi:hypothetical protein
LFSLEDLFVLVQFSLGHEKPLIFVDELMKLRNLIESYIFDAELINIEVGNQYRKLQSKVETDQF